MKKTRAFFLFFFINVWALHAQYGLSVLPKITTAERDSLSGVKEGSAFLNITTGCINYRFQEQWMEICGHCTPYPEATIIDSIFYENGEAHIYFSPFHEGCTYTVFNNVDNIVLKGNSSPIVSNALKPNIEYRFRCQAKSNCGESKLSDWSAPFTTSPTDYCRGISQFTDKRSGKIYTTISSGRACWMQEELVTDSGSTPKDTECKTIGFVTYYSWKYANNPPLDNNQKNGQGVCPDGWHLPKQSEVLALRIHLQRNPTIGFFKNPKGFLDVTEIKIVEKNYYSYWTSENHSFILSTGEGLEILSKEIPFTLPVRCVMD